MSIELHKIYKRKKSDRDIFQELMPFKIKEILLIANYYDAYTIEREGQFTDKIVGGIFTGQPVYRPPVLLLSPAKQKP